MANTLLFCDAAEKYRQSSEALNEVNLSNKVVVKKTLVGMMQQSFFHGASRFGTNFIA
jgi:hypothetical protein